MCLVSTVSLQGMKTDVLENVLVIVRMVLWLFDFGSFTIKSIAMDSKGRVYVSYVMGKGVVWGW